MSEAIAEPSAAPVRSGPSVRRGKSRQDYQTPRELLDAVEARFGVLRHDLAAAAHNAVCENFYDEHRSAFEHDWQALAGNLWCNPPFDDIAPWAKKAAESASSRTRILLLTPASVGSNWFAQHVHPHAAVFALSPRVSFDGENPYPKDLILSVYGLGVTGFSVWRWRP